MTKTHVTIRIDSDLWESFQELYPRQASPMIEDYLKEVISSESHGGKSREEILQQISEINKNRIEAERKEAILQRQLKSYDEVVLERKELLEGTEAQKKKESYKNLSVAIKSTFSDLCEALKEFEVFGFGDPSIPFNFYYELDQDKLQDLIEFADKEQLFKVRACALKLSKQRLHTEGQEQ